MTTSEFLNYLKAVDWLESPEDKVRESASLLSTVDLSSDISRERAGGVSSFIDFFRIIQPYFQNIKEFKPVLTDVIYRGLDAKTVSSMLQGELDTIVSFINSNPSVLNKDTLLRMIKNIPVDDRNYGSVIYLLQNKSTGLSKNDVRDIMLSSRDQIVDYHVKSGFTYGFNSNFFSVNLSDSGYKIDVRDLFSMGFLDFKEPLSEEEAAFSLASYLSLILDNDPNLIRFISSNRFEHFLNLINDIGASKNIGGIGSLLGSVDLEEEGGALRIHRIGVRSLLKVIYLAKKHEVPAETLKSKLRIKSQGIEGYEGIYDFEANEVLIDGLMQNENEAAEFIEKFILDQAVSANALEVVSVTESLLGSTSQKFLEQSLDSSIMVKRLELQRDSETDLISKDIELGEEGFSEVYLNTPITPVNLDHKKIEALIGLWLKHDVNPATYKALGFLKEDQMKYGLSRLMESASSELAYELFSSFSSIRSVNRLTLTSANLDRKMALALTDYLIENKESLKRRIGSKLFSKICNEASKLECFNSFNVESVNKTVSYSKFFMENGSTKKVRENWIKNIMTRSMKVTPLSLLTGLVFSEINTDIRLTLSNHLYDQLRRKLESIVVEKGSLSRLIRVPDIENYTSEKASSEIEKTEIRKCLVGEYKSMLRGIFQEVPGLIYAFSRHTRKDDKAVLQNLFRSSLFVDSCDVDLDDLFSEVLAHDFKNKGPGYDLLLKSKGQFADFVSKNTVLEFLQTPSDRFNELFLSIIPERMVALVSAFKNSNINDFNPVEKEGLKQAVNSPDFKENLIALVDRIHEEGLGNQLPDIMKKEYEKLKVDDYQNDILSELSVSLNNY
ncbi:MAG: hypothetical protein IBX55_01010 [Methyloprofundus sp.]|nr:hypothetical protein [Methyloprofundus sp.]